MRLSSLILTIGPLLVASSAPAQLSPDDVAGARRLLEQQRSRPRDDGDQAELKELIRSHRYDEAQKLLDDRLALIRVATPEALAPYHEIKTRLLIQAWRLDDAASLARTLPRRDLWLGRIQLLEKQYDAALRSAKAAQVARPQDAEGYLLEEIGRASCRERV